VVSTEATQEAPDLVSVRKGDLDTLVTACLSWLPDDVNPEVRAAFGRLDDARHGAGSETPPAEPEPEADPRPPGIWGRIEMPGFRKHTGWITEEMRFGLPMAVVRDWDGLETAMVGVGPGCRIVPLPTPLKRPETPRALVAGGGYDEADDPDDERSWGGF
jgi:hypothetical protein